MAFSLYNAIFSATVLALLLCSTSFAARESMMFSKVSSSASEKPTVTETADPTKVSTAEIESISVDTTEKNQNEKNYGIYGSQDFKDQYEKYSTRRGEGMSDTRSMEGGKYFYDIAGEEQELKKQNSPYESSLNSMQFHNGEGLSDTRAMDGGKYYYDVSGAGHGEAYSNFNGVNFHGSESLPSSEFSNGDAERLGQEKYEYDLRNNPAGEKEEFSQTEDKVNSFVGQDEASHWNAGQNEERFVFDTMEEYDKYMASRQYKYKP